MKRLAQVDIGQQLFIGWGRGIRAIGTIGEIVTTILTNIYILAGVIFFLLLIFFGLGIIIGAGEQSPEKIQKSRQAFTWTIVGFLFIFGSYWIIQIVQVITGIDILSPGI